MSDTIYFGLDTGSTRNASALVGILKGSKWTIIRVRGWHGSASSPLDHRNVVGPEAADIVLEAGGTSWCIDAFEQGPIKLVSKDKGLIVRVQGGELAEVYRHGRSVIHAERLQVSREVDPADWEEIKAGCARVQGERKGGKERVWLPEHGSGHFDKASAFLRAMYDAKAGDEVGMSRPSAFGGQSYVAQTRGAGWYPTPGY
jgi:hypothetical protein